MQKHAGIRCQKGPKWQICEINFSRKLSVLQYIRRYYPFMDTLGASHVKDSQWLVERKLVIPYTLIVKLLRMGFQVRKVTYFV